MGSQATQLFTGLVSKEWHIETSIIIIILALTFGNIVYSYFCILHITESICRCTPHLENLPWQSFE